MGRLRMRCSLRLLGITALAAFLLSLASHTSAQDAVDEIPIPLGDFNISGSTTAGYRFDDVKGYEPQYREMFDLGRGFRVLDVNLNGEAQEGKNPFADTFFLQLSNLGGDPFPTAQFMVAKKHLYDLRVDWRQSYFFWNQNDSVVLPIAAVGTGLGTGKGLTNNHDWDTVRKFGNVDFTLHATNNLRFRFNYYRTSDEGATFTTRSPDFFDSPSYWGTYARANPYYLFAPLADYANRFTGGVDYSVGDWSFHYNVGYQVFTENINLNNVASPETSIDPAAPSPTEPILNLSGTQFRRLTTPISEFSFVGKPASKLEWRGGYTFYRYSGPATFTQAFNGTAPNAGGALAPYAVSENATANVTEPNNMLTQGLTYHIYRWWAVDADYRYSRFTTDSTGGYESLLNGVTSATGTTNMMWRDGLSNFTLELNFTPKNSLTIRPGIEILKSDVESLTNGVVDPEITLRTKTVSPVISFGYEPTRIFSIRGDFHTTDNGASYTAITPHTEQGGHFVVHIHPTDKVSIEDEGNFQTSELLTTNFNSSLGANATTISYSMGDRLSLFAGFSYQSYYAQGNILYARGTAPLTDFLRDQEINRVWSGGIEAKPTKRSGLRVSGNFDRSTGVGQILGVPFGSTPASHNEPPAYGPLTWPLVTGTAYYNLPAAGQIAVDLQRTYYIQQIVTVNNFSANLLTIRWTKGF